MITNEMRAYKNIIKYKIDKFDILFENGDIESIEPGMINHLYIEKDFDVLFFPLINVAMAMKDTVYERINQESETVQFRMKIVKNIYDKDFKFLKYELFCNQLFRCFMDKTRVIKDNEQKKDKEKTENDSDSANYLGNTRNFYLFTDDVIKCKKILNLSVESADITDLVLYLIGECGIDKVLMSKLDNRETVNNLVIPNGNLIETIQYLDNLKGFYKKGLTLFFDTDCLYFIDKNAKCTSWRPNEVKTTHIHISNQKSGDSELNGQYISKDRKQNHVFANTNRVDMVNTNIVHDQLKGNQLVVIDSKSNNVTDITGESTQIGDPNKHILSTKSQNSFTISNIQTTLQENECMCDISFLGVDINIFTPNKEIILTYEDPEFNKKYSGNYRIVKIISAFKKDAEELVGEVQVSLKRQK
jgi:hypothetical protein